MITSNVFSNQANAMVMGRGNVIVGGTRSVVVGDGHIVSENDLVGDNLITASINGTSTSELFPSFVQTNDTDLTLWNHGQGGQPTNTSYGNAALRSNTTGYENTAIGGGALANNIIGNSNTAVGLGTLLTNTSDDNTALGVDALHDNTTGSANTAIGLDALQNNTIGNNNTALGINTDSGDFDASIILGRAATATASNQFVTGSVAYPAGAVSVAAAAQTRTWDVIINGVAHKILLA
jgi:hypothetical protein